MQLGVDRLLHDATLRAKLKNQRIAIVGHPASMTHDFRHSIDALMACGDLKITCAFGPQHGLRGDKQDNMVETEDFIDPIHQIPIFSLYGKVRRPTDEMLSHFDTVLVDLQDLGTRIYTFITTLLYLLESCARTGKSIWVLDRPNPAGRPIEGMTLRKGWESFVGAGPIPMRHGLTLGELAQWFVKHYNLKVDLQVIAMKDYQPNAGPGFGWPQGELSWVNPSPNAPSLAMARSYPGTVMLEGTHLSEGRGTTKPLEVLGAPQLDISKILSTMQKLAPEWLGGCKIRPCFFEPTFHKHAGKMCAGFQIHAEEPHYRHELFKPYRLTALAFKAIRIHHPEFELWRNFPYEYETDRLAIDLINGGPELREWVDNPHSTPAELEHHLTLDENAWLQERRNVLIY